MKVFVCLAFLKKKPFTSNPQSMQFILKNLNVTKLKIDNIHISSDLPVQQKNSGWPYIRIVGWLVGRLQC